MPRVLVFCKSTHKDWPADDSEKTKWGTTLKIKHPSINGFILDLTETQTARPSQHSARQAVECAAPHVECVLILLRALHYTKHEDTALRIARAHAPSLTYTENICDMLAMLCAHEELKTLALKTFKYELWCTSNLHPILYNLVPFLGPYVRSDPRVTRMYESSCVLTYSHTSPVPKGRPKSFVNKGALLDAKDALTTSNMYYATTKDIPERYDDFITEMNDMFAKMRCVSPIWKQSRHPGDARAQFNEIKTNIQILMAEYSLACDAYCDHVSVL